MQKIMFNDKYGLTQAVLDGRKTMTRRTIKHRDSYEGREFGYYSYHPGTMAMSPNNNGQHFFVELLDSDESPYDTERHASSEFAVAEEVSIAMSYERLEHEARMKGSQYLLGDKLTKVPGFKNKMFVNANYMPHHILITSIRVEHLQDISDEDCLCEGIEVHQPITITDGSIPILGDADGYTFQCGELYKTPREAFAALIDKVSGKGTWESNPLVWVYSFKLID